MREYEIAIIGGGASGLCAAIAAAETAKKAGVAAKIVLLERGQRVGKKLLATGNGRCNLSNRNTAPARYHGEDISFIEPAFARFSVKQNMDFFYKMGLLMVEEADGKLYPRSLQAAAVLDVLRMELERLSVETICDWEVRTLEKQGQFLLSNGQETIGAARVILAAGGAASPTLGGTESGYQLLKRFGHRVTPLLPSIVQLKVDMSDAKGLAGIKIDGIATLFQQGAVVAQEFGEILFTEYGLSGPPILQLSGIVSRAIAQGASTEITLDMVPELEENALRRLLKGRASARPDKPLEHFLTGFLHKRLALCALKIAKITPLSRLAETLTDRELAAVAATLKHLRLRILDTNGMRNAQVTAGGAEVSDFAADTMESKRVSGLYACGEVLDIDGDCGGFNLQWAWSSGRLAGESAVASLCR